jgi:hypothetical protein
MKFVKPITMLLAVVVSSPAAFAQPHLCFMLLPSKIEAMRYLNLSAVQYVDVTDSTLSIHLQGAGVSAKSFIDVPIRSKDEGYLWVSKMQAQAQTCKTEIQFLPPLPSHLPPPKIIPKEPAYK